MKKAILLFVIFFTFLPVLSKTKLPTMASMDVNLVTNSFTAGQLNFTLTVINTSDEMLMNVQLFSSGITFNSPLQILGPFQIITIEGTKPFSGCSDTNFVSVTAMTVNEEFVSPPPAMSEYIAPQASAPYITSVVTPDCIQVPVTGNMQITLAGLPSGNWTLHGTNSNYSISGSGSTVVLNLSPATVGNYMSFYYDADNGCSSAMSQMVMSNEIHGFDLNAPMTGFYVDANSDGIVNVGDEIHYQIMVTNTRACQLNQVRINGFAPSYTNPNLSFSGNPNIAVDVVGYSTLVVPATYTITAQNISNGFVSNSTSVNPHWSDALGGNSSSYSPNCVTTLNVLSISEATFQNFEAYPNPVENVWKIANGSSIEKVEIMTLLGQYVRTIKVHGLNADIDLSDLSSGSYIARIHAGQQVKAVKIIKS